MASTVESANRQIHPPRRRTAAACVRSEWALPVALECN